MNRLTIAATAIAALASVSCVSKIDESAVLPAKDGKQIVLIASTEALPDVRTTYEYDAQNPKMYWNPEDKISIFYGAGTDGGSEFTSTNTENCTVASFIGSISVISVSTEDDTEQVNFTGVYPYRSDNACEVSATDGILVTTALSDQQTACADSFDDDTFISMGYSEGLRIGFKSLCSGVRFTVDRDDITSVTIQGNNGEILAGRIKAGWENNVPVVKQVIEGKTSVTLSAPEGETFEPGVNYFITTLPVSFSAGMTMTFLGNVDNGVRRWSSAFQLKRNKFTGWNSVDSRAQFEKAYLPSGKEFNAAVKSLVAGTEKNFDDEDYTIPKITFKTGIITDTGSYIVLNEDTVPIYFSWDGNKELVVSTEATEFVANKDCSYMFSDMNNLSALTYFTSVNTAFVTDMTAMFKNCKLKTIQLTSSTASVTDMEQMFAGCYNLRTLNLSHFNTSNCLDFKWMFDGTVSLNELTLGDDFEIGSQAVTREMFGQIPYDNTMMGFGNADPRTRIICSSELVETIIDILDTQLPHYTFDAVLADQITLTPSVTLYENSFETLTAIVGPAYAGDKSVTWTSNRPSVATVTTASEGSCTARVTGISAGTATITCTTNDGSNISVSCNVTVTPHGYVQLWAGGPLWATENIGATSLGDTGYYFAYGYTEGCIRNSDDNGWVLASDGTTPKSFNTTDFPNRNASTFQDAATAAWGGDWRTPTKNEIDNLCDPDYTTVSYVNENGVNGYRIYGKGAYASRSIFIPAHGTASSTNLIISDTYLSSRAVSNGSREVQALSPNGIITTQVRLWAGLPVRPVMSGDQSIVITGDYSNIGVGWTLQLKASVGGDELPNSSITWSSGNTSIATVDSNGKVTALSNGTVEIRASIYNGAIVGSYWLKVTPTMGKTNITAAYFNNIGIIYYVNYGRPDTSYYSYCTWVQLWSGGPKFATFNLGSKKDTYVDATSTKAYLGGLYSYGHVDYDYRDYNSFNGFIWRDYWYEYDHTETGLVSDMAAAAWGPNWRMPTPSEFNALNTNCDFTYYDGSNSQVVEGCTLAGWKISGRGEYAGNYIFLPMTGTFSFAGDSADGEPEFLSITRYWTSPQQDGNVTKISALINDYIGSGVITTLSAECRRGNPVRPVVAD